MEAKYIYETTVNFYRIMRHHLLADNIFFLIITIPLGFIASVPISNNFMPHVHGKLNSSVWGNKEASGGLVYALHRKLQQTLCPLLSLFLVIPYIIQLTISVDSFHLITGGNDVNKDN
jgi:hypothetical protein